MKKKNLLDDKKYLTVKDISFIMWAVNLYGNLPQPVHMGSVLFVERLLALRCLGDVLRASRDNDSKEARAAKRVLGRLKETHDSNTVTFSISLSDREMWRAAKKVGERHILALPFKMKTNAGLQFQVFGKKWVKPEIDVSVNADVFQIGKNLWAVTVQKTFAQPTKEFLFDKYRYVEG